MINRRNFLKGCLAACLATPATQLLAEKEKQPELPLINDHANLDIYDNLEPPGEYTKRLVESMKKVMRRNGGDNLPNVKESREKLTDIYISPEAMEDIRNWQVDQIDEVTRKEVLTNGVPIRRIFSCNVTDLDNFDLPIERTVTKVGGKI
jgi:hypothetical protein